MSINCMFIVDLLFIVHVNVQVCVNVFANDVSQKSKSYQNNYEFYRVQIKLAKLIFHMSASSRTLYRKQVLN